MVAAPSPLYRLRPSVRTRVPGAHRMGVSRFVHAVSTVLAGVLRPERLAEEADGPRHLPGHGRGPSGGDGSLAIRSQHLLQPVPPPAASPRVAAPRPPCSSRHPPSVLPLWSAANLLDSRLPLYRGSGWRRIGQKVDQGGRDSRARASVFCAATSSSRRLPNSSGTFGPEDVRWPGGDHLLLRANSKAPRFVTESGGSVAAATACARSGATCLPIR